MYVAQLSLWGQGLLFHPSIFNVFVLLVSKKLLVFRILNFDYGYFNYYYHL